MKENKIIYDMALTESKDQRNHTRKEMMPFELTAVTVDDCMNIPTSMLEVNSYTITAQRIKIGETVYNIRIPDFLYTMIQKEAEVDARMRHMNLRDSLTRDLARAHGKLEKYRGADFFSWLRYLFKGFI